MAKKPQRKNTGLIVFLIALIIASIAATAFVIWLCIDMANQDPAHLQSPEQSVQLPTEYSEPTVEVTTEPTVPPTTTEPPQPPSER